MKVELLRKELNRFNDDDDIDLEIYRVLTSHGTLAGTKDIMKVKRNTPEKPTFETEVIIR